MFSAACALATLEKGAGIIRIGADGGDRLVDLMGNSGGDLAEDRQSVRLDEVLLHGLELLGGLPVVGDLGFETVARHAQVARPLLDTRLKRVAGQPLLGAAHGDDLATAQEQCGKCEKRYERGKGEELRFPRTRGKRCLQRRQLLEPPVRRRHHGFHAQEGCVGVARKQGVQRGGAIGPALRSSGKAAAAAVASPNCRLSRMGASRSSGIGFVVMKRQEGRLVMRTMPRRSVT